MAQSGDIDITEIEWAGPQSLAVTVSTSRDDLYPQIYIGRQLAAEAPLPGSQTLILQIRDTHSPTPITPILVDVSELGTDFGPDIARRPWNTYRVSWTASGMAGDTAWFEVCAGTEAGGAIDYDHPEQRQEYLGDGDYTAELDSFYESGAWNVGILPRDNALPNGNAGTALEGSVDASVYPPDVLVDASGNRLTVDISGGVVTVGFSYDWEPA